MSVFQGSPGSKAWNSKPKSWCWKSWRLTRSPRPKIRPGVTIGQRPAGGYAPPASAL